MEAARVAGSFLFLKRGPSRNQFNHILFLLWLGPSYRQLREDVQKSLGSETGSYRIAAG